MRVFVRPGGCVEHIYDERIDLSELGTQIIRRASRVEPEKGGGWSADLRLSSGPKLGPYRTRSEAIAAEIAWLNANSLGSG